MTIQKKPQNKFQNKPRKNPLVIAVCQLCSSMDPLSNARIITDLIDQAKARKVDWIAFPENSLLFSNGFKMMKDFSKLIEKEIIPSLVKTSRNISVHIGSVALWNQKAQKFTNTSLVFQNGTIISRYDKIHLFDTEVAGDRQYRESDTILGGTKTVTFSSNGTVFGHSICFDLRFPEHYKALTRKKAEILFIPSAFTFKTGEKHWDILTRARAIENQAYVVAPAQGGTHENGRETWGHTRIVDFDGNVVAETNNPNSMAISETDLSELRKLRKSFPVVFARK